MRIYREQCLSFVSSELSTESNWSLGCCSAGLRSIFYLISLSQSLSEKFQVKAKAKTNPDTKSEFKSKSESYKHPLPHAGSADSGLATEP